MTRPIVFFAVSLILSAVATAQEDDELAQVVVTGTLIRRSQEDIATPVVAVGVDAGAAAIGAAVSGGGFAGGPTMVGASTGCGGP